MSLQYVIVYLLLTATSASEDSVYCSLRYTRLCQEKGQHVACQYPDPGQGESCENYNPIEFTEELKNFILNYINRHRHRLAAGHERARGGLPIPKPEIMMYVEWDRELAHLAQRLADQCRFVHDECRATVRYPYAGQTVGEVRWRRIRDSDELNAERAIRKVLDAWWGEKRRVQPQQMTSPFKITNKGAVWGHFTQLAIWKLRAIGCGAVRHGPSHPRLLLVCDYSHTNMLGQKTIQPGPLATCPPHTARRPHSPYPLLCSTIKYKTRHYESERDDYELEKEISRSEILEEFDEEEEEEEQEEVPSTLIYRNRDATRTLEDIYVKRFKTTCDVFRKQDGRGDEYAREVTSEDEYYKETEVNIQIRKEMKNVQDYQLEDIRSSTTNRYHDFEEERNNDIHVPFRDRSHYNKKSDFENERRNNVVSNYRDYGHYEKKIPNQSNEDYSVIPLKTRQQEQVNDINVPWRPKLYQRTSTMENPEYETSIIMVPVRKKGHRMSTGAVATLPTNVVRDILRTFHDSETKTRPPTRVRVKNLFHTIRRPLAPSLKLDKEDIDQLFRDTGFKPKWTPKV